MSVEIFDVVDRLGRVVGQAPRSECHGNPALIHQAVHVAVFDREGRLFLQLRSAQKDIQPGKWDISVGGHLQPGETPLQGAHRELLEELGVRASRLEKAYEYFWESSLETELIRTYFTLHEGPFTLQAEELADGRFWRMDEIESALPTGFATPQFAFEFPRLRAWWDRKRTDMTQFTRA
ncbi:MAG TPA: NUDIX domain-containing protein [Kiritimatiellia bacterium]|nr:NUDIX domain-containing protein [Kiritimatiellia bacterium]